MSPELGEKSSLKIKIGRGEGTSAYKWCLSHKTRGVHLQAK